MVKVTVYVLFDTYGEVVVGVFATEAAAHEWAALLGLDVYTVDAMTVQGI